MDLDAVLRRISLQHNDNGVTAAAHLRDDDALGSLAGNPLTADLAIAELRRLLEAVRAGQSPEALGLVPTPGPESAELAAWRTAVFSHDPLDLDVFRALGGEERLRGSALLFGLVADHDRRGPRAIEQLGISPADAIS